MNQDPKSGDRMCTCGHAERLHHDDECANRTRPYDGSIVEWQCACEGFTDAANPAPPTGAK